MKRYVLISSNLGDHSDLAHPDRCQPSPAILADVNSKKLRLIVDTGSDSSFFTPAGFSKLGIGPEKVRAEGLCSGMGGTSTALQIFEDFTVLGKHTSGMGVFMDDLGANDGLLGMDVLAQFKRVTFDLEHKQLILED